MGGGRGSGISNFKVKVTNMVMMEFNDKFEIGAASVYEKYSNNVIMPAGAGFLSPHTMALMVKAMGGFDYDYTVMDKTRSNFVVGYSDFEKGKDYRGRSFNSISYYNDKFSTDKIKLESKASSMKVFPAKTGSVMILEYFKKEKKLELRLEKLN